MKKLILLFVLIPFIGLSQDKQVEEVFIDEAVFSLDATFIEKDTDYVKYSDNDYRNTIYHYYTLPSYNDVDDLKYAIRLLINEYNDVEMIRPWSFYDNESDEFNNGQVTYLKVDGHIVVIYYYELSNGQKMLQFAHEKR